MTREALFAIAAVLALVGTALAGGVAAADSAGNADLSVDVTQDDDGEATVSVSKNDTGVANASVVVAAVENATYAGTGNYTTDDEGLFELPAPEENATVDVTAEADGEVATVTTDLFAAETENDTGPAVDSFGLQVSSFVHELLADENRTGGIGFQVATFVTANNPGNAPANAGPPAWLFGDVQDHDDGDDADEEDEIDDRRGPPEDAGPPADAGPPDEDDEETDDDSEDDSEEEKEADEDETDTEDDEDDGAEEAEEEPEEDEEEKDRRGPPEDRGPG